MSIKEIYRLMFDSELEPKMVITYVSSMGVYHINIEINTLYPTWAFCNGVTRKLPKRTKRHFVLCPNKWREEIKKLP